MSTISELKAAYDANAGYDLPGGSVGMAGDFVLACRRLINALNDRVKMGQGETEIEKQVAVYERAIAAAQRWLYSQNVRTNGQNRRVLRRGDGFAPTFPGPYYG